MQTRQQTIAQLREEIAEKDKKIWAFKLMVFGGPLQEGSIFESVGMIDQLEQKDKQIEELKKEINDLTERNGIMEQTWISEQDAELIHDEYLESIDVLKMELDDMTCLALNHWSGGQLTWDYDNRKPVIKKGKYRNIEMSAPDDWQELLDTLE